uniref:Uncharacterized protein n=1 Tax=Arundo donax TaxID=35708 RepID=A0A0A8YML5_ARUDO
MFLLICITWNWVFTWSETANLKW